MCHNNKKMPLSTAHCLNTSRRQSSYGVNIPWSSWWCDFTFHIFLGRSLNFHQDDWNFHQTRSKTSLRTNWSLCPRTKTWSPWKLRFFGEKNDLDSFRISLLFWKKIGKPLKICKMTNFEINVFDRLWWKFQSIWWKFNVPPLFCCFDLPNHQIWSKSGPSGVTEVCP